MPLLRVIDRNGVEHQVEAKTGLKVMETLRDLEYGVAAICGGMCSCATCHVYVDPEWTSKLPAAMSDERELLAGRNVLVTAHGNSLRAMVKMLDNRSEADIVELNIPTGVPLLYELDAKLAPISSRYLGDPAAIAAAAEAVRRQTEKR